MTAPQIMLTAKEAAATLSICVTTLYRGVAQGWLPRPRQLGDRGSRWLLAEIGAAAAALPLADNAPGPGRRKRGGNNSASGG